jgi:hypothetical protein
MDSSKTNDLSLLDGKKKKEIFCQIEMVYPELLHEHNHRLSKNDTILVAYTVTPNAHSSQYLSIKSSIPKVHTTINKVSNNVITVLSCMNTISYIISNTKPVKLAL